MQFTFHDISYAQGLYNMDLDSSPAVFMRMSYFGYGDKKGHYDDQAARNYNNAIRLGKLPGLYHFAGGGDPVAEADFFIAACSPLADGDLLILDYELTSEMNPPADPAAWCLAFVERVKERTGKYPLFYTYFAMLQQYGFETVLQRCGLWVAHYGIGPNEDIPGCPPYIIHQFQGSPLDTNASYLDLATLKKYAYSANQPQPQPAPEPTPAPDIPVSVPEQPVPVSPAPTTSPQDDLLEDDFEEDDNIWTGPREQEPYPPSPAPDPVQYEQPEPVETTPDKAPNPKLEALKEVGRLILFALPAVLIQIFTDDPDLALGFGIPLLAALRYLDKYLHESEEHDVKGIAPF